MTRTLRDRMEKKLPPLRYPSLPDKPAPVPGIVVRIGDEEKQAARLERRRFQRRLDARMAALAFEMGCDPEECIALAIWMGKQGWTAFAVMFPEVEGNPTDDVFSRNLLIGAAEYDAQGKHRGDNAKRLEARAKPLLEGENQKSYSEKTVGNYVRTRNAAHKPRNSELLAIDDGDESQMPLALVEERRRQQVKRELRLSAARLTSEWKRSAKTPMHQDHQHDSELPDPRE